MQTAPLRVKLITSATVDETTSKWIDVSAYPHITFYLKGVGTISSGVLTIEEADFDPLTEREPGLTGSTITTINAADVTGGAQKGYHCPAPSAYAFVRARISTAIGGGGDLSVVLRAN